MASQAGRICLIGRKRLTPTEESTWIGLGSHATIGGMRPATRETIETLARREMRENLGIRVISVNPTHATIASRLAHAIVGTTGQQTPV